MKAADLMNATFLEEAADELKKEVARIEARAAELKSSPPTEALPNFAEFSLIKCSNICGQCCVCSIC